ncbi:MAG: helix-turn-helix transcriptional regulator [Alphaproteobacteria bacterium]|nr:helix-turn-helix transcriptional regulator [Alphaproteobacteria bacterium]
MHWLTRRLKELKKSKRQLALLLNVHPTRMNDLEKGDWKFQVTHIKKTAKFLEFEKEAFLDFIAGDISESELWNYQPRICVSQEEFNLLKAIKEVLKKDQ